MRHGFSEAYSSEEFLQALEKNYFLYWTDTRHERVGLPKPPSSDPADNKIDWRNRDRIRTASAVLVVCLRIGYDPRRDQDGSLRETRMLGRPLRPRERQGDGTNRKEPSTTVREPRRYTKDSLQAI
ncbi:uncharacterized protein JCM6883_006251, partial [Sporobolomyces salmoneus]|uniref:uncharacterized protein n=1 Tax=Sporobolomyces salmoneus TaxID=183962 RepID=UPI00316FFC06